VGHGVQTVATETILAPAEFWWPSIRPDSHVHTNARDGTGHQRLLSHMDVEWQQNLVAEAWVAIAILRFIGVDAVRRHC